MYEAESDEDIFTRQSADMDDVGADAPPAAQPAAKPAAAPRKFKLNQWHIMGLGLLLVTGYTAFDYYQNAQSQRAPNALSRLPASPAGAALSRNVRPRAEAPAAPVPLTPAATVGDQTPLAVAGAASVATSASGWGEPATAAPPPSAALSPHLAPVAPPQARVDTLQQRYDALEGRLAALETEIATLRANGPRPARTTETASAAGPVRRPTPSAQRRRVPEGPAPAAPVAPPPAPLASYTLSGIYGNEAWIAHDGRTYIVQVGDRLGPAMVVSIDSGARRVTTDLGSLR